MQFNTSAGAVEIIHPRDMVPLVPVEKVYQTVQQYPVQQTNIIASSQFSGYGPSTAPPVATYQRNVKTIDRFSDYEYFILNSFVSDLHGHGRVLDVKPESFEEAVQDACVECLNNFGIPTHVVVFNPNVIVAGQFDKDAICFKEAAPNYGALLTYMPNKFTIVYSPKPCPYFGVESKYGQFVSNVLIMGTMERLGLK